MPFHPPTRRRFLKSAAAGSVAFGLGDLSMIAGLRPVPAAETQLDPKLVRFGPDIEPMVRFLEDTPRDTILEQLLARIKHDLSYRELLAGLLLAGIRNIPGAALASHRNVGGELHSVFVINSAHLASLASPAGERWLPILWAVDKFKISHSRPVRGGRRRPQWQMQAVDESAVPSASNAERAFVDALDNWDEAAADPAAAALARSAGAGEVFEVLCRYAARDFRYIGHKAIYVANAWRTLRTIGWQHAEPVVRSLARALAAYFHDQGHPARTDQLADRAWRQNRELATTIRKDWQSGKQDSWATTDLLAVFREGNDLQASEAVVGLLNRQIGPQTIWDAIHGGVAELLMIQPGFSELHAVTTANAIHYAYRTSKNDQTKRGLLLQAASFVPLFAGDVNGSRNALKSLGVQKRIDRLQPQLLEGDANAAVEEILADAGRHPMAASGKTLSYLQGGGDVKALMARARQLIFRKGDDHHDYKYSSAVFEDYDALSPAWREPYLAAAMYQLRGSHLPDTALAGRLAGRT